MAAFCFAHRFLVPSSDVDMCADRVTMRNGMLRIFIGKQSITVTQLNKWSADWSRHKDLDPLGMGARVLSSGFRPNMGD